MTASPVVPFVPSPFVTSYTNFVLYPENLLFRTISLRALRSDRIRLDDKQKKIFASENDIVNVPFRDLASHGQAFIKHKVQSDEDLQDWLGDESRMVPGRLTKKDPKCRFIFLYSDHSLSRLHITRKMFVRLLSYHQTNPRYLELIYTFGVHAHARDPRFSGFYTQTTFSGSQKLKLEDLGRSGLQFQLCYNLKSAGVWSDTGFNSGRPKWSIRQGAFHHQFDVKTGTSLWIITRAALDIKEAVEEITGRSGNEEDRRFDSPEACLRSSFAVHLALCHWATERWREYVQWLEDEIENTTSSILEDFRNLDDSKRLNSLSQLRTAQIFEERADEAIMVLQGNCDVLSSLRRFYEGLVKQTPFTLHQTCCDNIFSFGDQIGSFTYESEMQIARARLLTRIVATRKAIILQDLQNQATEQTKQLTISMQRDSTTVRIIGLMTFLYLPGTFVSTFFSTDVVKYQNQNDSSSDSSTNSQTTSQSYSALALVRWLEVTLPLTLLTFAGAGLWFWLVDRKNKKMAGLLPIKQTKDLTI